MNQWMEQHCSQLPATFHQRTHAGMTHREIQRGYKTTVADWVPPSDKQAQFSPSSVKRQMVWTEWRAL